MNSILRLHNLTILVFAAFFCLACSKKTIHPEKETKSIELTKEVDITSLGQLSVSTENEKGARGNKGSMKLVDNDEHSQFLTEHTPSFFIQMTFPEPKQIAAYKITSGDIYSVRDPMNWTITASNDAIKWVELDARIAEDFDFRKLTRRYDFKNTTKYKYYRWNITATHWDHYLEIGELRLFSVPEKDQIVNPVSTTTKTQKDDITLIFIDKTKGINAQQKQSMIDVFFATYPVLIQEFNPEAIKTVYFKIDPTYDGPAAAIASQGLILYGANYMNNNQRDIDIVIHESMHLIQNYSIGPGWVAEGIADYVRHVYGLNNAAVGWALSAPKIGESYTNGYGSAARIFVWLEKHIQTGIVKKLNLAMRKGTYTGQFWVNETGKNIDQLWADYIKNPAL